jgi:hypothetical protein
MKKMIQMKELKESSSRNRDLRASYVQLLFNGFLIMRDARVHSVNVIASGALPVRIRST